MSGDRRASYGSLISGRRDDQNAAPGCVIESLAQRGLPCTRRLDKRSTQVDDARARPHSIYYCRGEFPSSGTRSFTISRGCLRENRTREKTASGTDRRGARITPSRPACPSRKCHEHTRSWKGFGTRQRNHPRSLECACPRKRDASTRQARLSLRRRRSGCQKCVPSGAVAQQVRQDSSAQQQSRLC